MKKILFLMVLAFLMMAAFTQAQTFGSNYNYGGAPQMATMPSASFQSTSRAISSNGGSGFSALSTRPTIDEDGRANGPMSGPRRVEERPGSGNNHAGTGNASGDNMIPVGNALLPMMLLALGYAAIVIRRKRRA